MSEKVYQTTEAQCRENHKGLVCSGCGNAIMPIETVNNANNPTFWSGCVECNRLQNGVPLEVFEAVNKCFKEHKFLSKNEIIQSRRDYCDIFQKIYYHYKKAKASRIKRYKVESIGFDDRLIKGDCGDYILFNDVF